MFSAGHFSFPFRWLLVFAVNDDSRFVCIAVQKIEVDDISYLYILTKKGIFCELKCNPSDVTCRAKAILPYHCSAARHFVMFNDRASALYHHSMCL